MIIALPLFFSAIVLVYYSGAYVLTVPYKLLGVSGKMELMSMVQDCSTASVCFQCCVKLISMNECINACQP